MIKRYRTQQKTVEAIKYTGLNKKDVLDFLGVQTKNLTAVQIMKEPELIRGKLIGYSKGDYIVKLNNGDFRVYSSSVFENKYCEAIDEDTLYNTQKMIADLRYISEKHERGQVSEIYTKIANQLELLLNKLY